MSKEQFFQDPHLPFVEARISKDSAGHFKPHMHRRFSVGAVVEGTAVFEIENQEYHLEPGILALINPETLHSCNPEAGASRSFSMVYLENKWCLQVQQILWQVEGFVPVHSHILYDNSLYRHYTKTIALLMEQPYDFLEKELLLVQLMAQVFSVACSQQIPADSPSSLTIEELKRLLSGELERELTMAEAAKKFNANPYTLLRQFRRATGITPHLYRMNCRIEHARTLLRKGWDIGDTALACGFYDQSHFHHHFRAMTTVTPKQYQQSVLKNQ